MGNAQQMYLFFFFCYFIFFFLLFLTKQGETKSLCCSYEVYLTCESFSNESFNNLMITSDQMHDLKISARLDFCFLPLWGKETRYTLVP